jgi:hypothetical protein
MTQDAQPTRIDRTSGGGGGPRARARSRVKKSRFGGGGVTELARRVIAILGWLAASLGFAYYVKNFGSYNTPYGSIGAVIVLLTWMYISGFFVLVGGEINAEIEHASSDGKNPGEKAPS